MYEFLGNTGIEVSPLLQNFGFVLVLFYNFLNFKRKKNLLSSFSQCNLRHFSVKKHKFLSKPGFWVSIEIIIISMAQFVLAPTYNSIYGDWWGTGLNYFGTLFISPFLLLVLFYYFSINPLKQMDLITPAHPLALIFVKLGCFCLGCCRGFECSWGLYFPSNGITCFPTQLLEVAQALILFIFFHKFKDKAKEGTVYPIYVIVYSVTRFFIEFTSDRIPEFWLVNLLHYSCVLGVIFGFLNLFIINKWSDKIVSVFSRGFIYENGRCRRAKLKKKRIKVSK